MNTITLFKFETSDIRAITDVQGEPWFVLRDLLTAMQTSTPTTVAVDAIKQGLGDGFNDVIPIIDSLGREQQATIVNEPAATYLLSRSNTEHGRKLNRFIHVEVLPQIRKTGRYAGIQHQALPDFTNPAEAARAWASEYEAKQAALVQLEAAQPAIEFHERVGDADSLHSIDEAAKALQAPPRKFRQALKSDLGLFRLDGLPKQDFIDRGYVRVIEQMIRLPQGDRPYHQTFFTGKGLQWIQRKLDHSLMGKEI